PGRKFKFIVGMLADKDYRSSIEEVSPLAESFATISPPSARALSSNALADVIKELTGINAEAYDSPAAALDAQLKLLGKDDILCIFGSLYQIGEIRDYFGK
ncbi:MAG: bifunctional folylpolyglutamate synthase/dihydrofolate synthase, partial [Oscillospiraceae bacterium]|nr:bifunctional folylpolyglutamate synthase/dihydrofolate synthase [Oscillospiraceae bacterium]